MRATTRTSRIIIAIVVIAIVVGLFVYLSSPSSFGRDPNTDIRKWHTDTEVIKDALISATLEDRTDQAARGDQCDRRCRRRGKIKRWRVQTDPIKRARDLEVILGGGGGRNCLGIRTVSHGGNAFDRSIVRFGMSSAWCWRHGRVTRYRLNTWGETDGWALWDYRGVQDVVKHCTNTPCRRVYRRVYAKFSRGVGSFSQNVTTWVAHSLRPGGDYYVDKM